MDDSQPTPEELLEQKLLRIHNRILKLGEIENGQALRQWACEGNVTDEKMRLIDEAVDVTERLIAEIEKVARRASGKWDR